MRRTVGYHMPCRSAGDVPTRENLSSAALVMLATSSLVADLLVISSII